MKHTEKVTNETEHEVFYPNQEVIDLLKGDAITKTPELGKYLESIRPDATGFQGTGIRLHWTQNNK